MRQSWMDQRLQYEHKKEQKKIPERKFVMNSKECAVFTYMPFGKIVELKKFMLHICELKEVYMILSQFSFF